MASSTSAGTAIYLDELIAKLVTVEQRCGKSATGRLELKYGLKWNDREVDGVGSVNIFDRTLHRFYVTSAESARAAIRINGAGPIGSHCTIFVVSISASGAHAGPPHLVGNRDVEFGDAERKELDKLSGRCEALGIKAGSVFYGGKYVQVGDSGEFAIVDHGFNCESAVSTNSSSVLVSFGDLKLMISTFADTVVIGKVGQI